MLSDADKSEVMVFKFGEESLSDIIFNVDDNEFHCHRTTLAAKCPYFATMFNSDFKEKTEKRIKIEADPMAFKHLMEVLYNGIFEDHKKFFSRLPQKNEQSRLQTLWSETCALFELADRFLVLDVVRNAFETHMIAAHGRGLCYGPCGTRLLLSLRFGMKGYKGVCKVERNTIIDVIRYLEPIQKEYTLSSEDIISFLIR